MFSQEMNNIHTKFKKQKETLDKEIDTQKNTVNGAGHIGNTKNKNANWRNRPPKTTTKTQPAASETRMKNEENRDPGLAEATAKTTPKTRSAESGTRMKNDGNRHPKAVSAGHFDTQKTLPAASETRMKNEDKWHPEPAEPTAKTTPKRGRPNRERE